MRRLLTLALLACMAAVPALARERAYGWCEQGNHQVYVSGVGSKAPAPSFAPTYWQQSFPSCTVRVYVSGTLTLATLYSDNSGTSLANPFTADSTGFWKFYANAGKYDVQISGTGLTPYTIADVPICDFLTEVCSFGGATGNLNIFSNGVLVGTRPTINFVNSAGLTWTITDDSINDRVNITQTVTGGGGAGCTPTGASTFLLTDSGSGGCVTSPTWSLDSFNRLTAVYSGTNYPQLDIFTDTVGSDVIQLGAPFGISFNNTHGLPVSIWNRDLNTSSGVISLYGGNFLSQGAFDEAIYGIKSSAVADHSLVAAGNAVRGIYGSVVQGTGLTLNAAFGGEFVNSIVGSGGATFNYLTGVRIAPVYSDGITSAGASAFKAWGLSVEGGKSYFGGDIVLQPEATTFPWGNNLVLGSNPLPMSQVTCDSTQRGRLHYINSGSGVADVLESCSKNTAGTYVWTSYAPGAFTAYTVATLPAAASNTGLSVVVTDASTAGSCTVGGGTAIALCRSSGAAWVPLGDGGGGGGSMVYPLAGVAVSTGSAWAASLTAPASGLVGLTDTQILTNKTLTLPVLGSYTFSSLPSAAANPNTLAVMTDAPTTGSCSTGGGTFYSICRSSGTSWLPVSATYSAAGISVSSGTGWTTPISWNSGTTTATMNITGNAGGNAATASALAGTPSTCGAGVSATGILSNGNATGCFTPGGGVYTPVTFSATPTFTVTGSANVTFEITLTGNVTSSTVSGALAGANLGFIICQDATGSRTFAWPTGFQSSGTVTPTASTCSMQTFRYDGTNYYATGPMTDTGVNGGLQQAGGTGSDLTPATNVGTFYYNLAANRWEVNMNNAGDKQLVVAGADINNSDQVTVTHLAAPLPAAQGGTNNGFFQVAGPATSAKTFTFPNANANVLTDNALVTVAQGGTGTATPSIVAGTNITVTGTWPNQTINSTGGGGDYVSLFSGKANYWVMADSNGGFDGTFTPNYSLTSGTCTRAKVATSAGFSQGTTVPTSATANNYCAWTSNQALSLTGRNMHFSSYWMLGQNTDTLSWIGLVDSNIATVQDPGASHWGALFLTCNDAGATCTSDYTTWQCLTRDGATGVTQTDSTITIDAAEHLFEVDITSAGAVTYKIDGTQVCASNTRTLSSGHVMEPWMSVMTMTTAAKSMTGYGFQLVADWK